MLHHCCILPKQVSSTAKTFNSWIHSSIDVNESDSCSARRKCNAKSSAFKNVCVLEWREERLVKDYVSGFLKQNSGYKIIPVMWTDREVLYEMAMESVMESLPHTLTREGSASSSIRLWLLPASLVHTDPTLAHAFIPETEINQNSGQKYHWKWR